MRNRALPADTSLDAARVQERVLQRLGFDGRWRMAVELSEMMRRNRTAEIRRSHPQYADDEVRLAEIRERLGEDLFHRAYPGVSVRF